jgi:hypothetical protein
MSTLPAFLWFRAGYAVLGLALVTGVTGSPVLTVEGPAWHEVHLPFGLSLHVPHSWHADAPLVEQAMRDGSPIIDATSLTTSGEGTLIMFSYEPRTESGGNTIQISLTPTNVSQYAMARMSDSDIRRAEEDEFRPEVEKTLRSNNAVLLDWLGTSKEMVGGRYGLVTRYRYRDPRGPTFTKETHSAYLGRKAIHFHVFRREPRSPEVEREINGILTSLNIGVEALN